jgi:WD40 repeat protein
VSGCAWAFKAVAPTDFTHFIELQGKIDALNIAMVTPRNGTGGQVKEIFVKKGDMVKKGQLLLKLDDVVLQQQLATAKQQLAFAKNLYERRKNLWAQQIGSEVELVNSKNLADQPEALAVRASGQNRLMVVQDGKDPAVLVNTTEETMAPLATCGAKEVAFMIGPAPHETIAFTEPASGRVVRRIAPGKGPVGSVSCSPDGRTLYFSARGAIWSIPSSGGEARNIRAGDRVVSDPSGRRLIIEAVEGSQLRLFSVPLDGSPEREIPLDHSIPLTRSPLSTSGLSADGRLLVPLAPPDSWFNPPAVIDTATGRITRIPSDSRSDYRSMGWTPDGQVIALKNGLRAALWKFQPAAR